MAQKGDWDPPMGWSYNSNGWLIYLTQAWVLDYIIHFPCRYENEQPFRKAVEDEINSLYKVIDDAKLTRMDLESQIENMNEELTLLSKNHEEVNQSWGTMWS